MMHFIVHILHSYLPVSRIALPCLCFVDTHLRNEFRHKLVLRTPFTQHDHPPFTDWACIPRSTILSDNHQTSPYLLTQLYI